MIEAATACYRAFAESLSRSFLGPISSWMLCKAKALERREVLWERESGGRQGGVREVERRQRERIERTQQEKSKVGEQKGGLYGKSKKNGQLQDSGAVPGKGVDLHIHGVRSEDWWQQAPI